MRTLGVRLAPFLFGLGLFILPHSVSAAWSASYWNLPIMSAEAPTFPTGDPDLTRTDSTIDFDWGLSSPNTEVINVNDFAASWTQTINFEAGYYTFTTSSDDGARVYIDGVMIMDYWVDQPATVHATSTSVTAGNHDVRVEFYENGGYASMEFTYTHTGVAFSESALSVTEAGATDTYTVALESVPSANVTINLDDVSNNVTVSPSTLTFTASNWSTPQTVTVTAEDNDTIGDGTDTINATTSSSDAGYNAMSLDSIAVAITDNDVADLEVNKTELAVVEGGDTDSYTVVLTAQPSADVTVTPNIVRPRARFTPTSLTFTSSNWNVPQTFTVTAIDNQAVEVEDTVVVKTRASSEDVNFDGKKANRIILSVTDNDSLERCFRTGTRQQRTSETKRSNYYVCFRGDAKYVKLYTESGEEIYNLQLSSDNETNYRKRLFNYYQDKPNEIFVLTMTDEGLLVRFLVIDPKTQLIESVAADVVAMKHPPTDTNDFRLKRNNRKLKVLYRGQVKARYYINQDHTLTPIE